MKPTLPLLKKPIPSAGWCALILVGCLPLEVAAQQTDFQQRHQQIKQRFEQRRDKPMNKLVHDPPMIAAADSKLDDGEYVIGVALDGETRAYPLTMLYGGGIFELLNDECGKQPIAVSW